MAPLQNILVGIDLTRCSQFSIEALPARAQDVFRRAVWLAQKSGGELTLLSALHLPEEHLLTLKEEHRLVLIRRSEKEIRQVLTELVQRAKESGVPATSVFVRGEGWLEIIR